MLIHKNVIYNGNILSTSTLNDNIIIINSQTQLQNSLYKFCGNSLQNSIIMNLYMILYKLIIFKSRI